MTLWSRSHSLQRKIITAIVLVGLLPLTLLLALTYVEERGARFTKQPAPLQRSRRGSRSRIEMQVSRGMKRGPAARHDPLLRTAVTEANRTYEGKDAQNIQGMIKDWQQRWRQRITERVSPLHHRIVTNYLIQWHDIRKSELCRDPGDRPAGGAGGQFHSTSGVFLREGAVVASGGERGESQGLCERDCL